MNISSVVITKNEEKTIERCLESLSFSDEIIVIDDNSVDRTVNIAEKFPNVKIYERNLNENFSKQRNFGLSKASGKWVLFIDADEEVTIPLRNEIMLASSDPFNKTCGYYIKRKDMIYGKKLNKGEWGKRKYLRFVQKNNAKWVRDVHEVLEIIGTKKTFKSYLLHDRSHKKIKDFIEKINNFSSMHAASNYKEGKSVNIIKIIFYPVLKFIDNYLIKGGFKDGDIGFIMSLIMSFHSFLGWTKLWELKKE
jgi:glycosyltransferase involved in cell wall biosynthesis